MNPSWPFLRSFRHFPRQLITSQLPTTNQPHLQQQNEQQLFSVLNSLSTLHKSPTHHKPHITTTSRSINTTTSNPTTSSISPLHQNSSHFPNNRLKSTPSQPTTSQPSQLTTKSSPKQRFSTTSPFSLILRSILTTSLKPSFKSHSCPSNLNSHQSIHSNDLKSRNSNFTSKSLSNPPTRTLSRAISTSHRLALKKHSQLHHPPTPQPHPLFFRKNSNLSKLLPTHTSSRFYRRRFFVDPAQSHQYSGWAQGFGYATRLEEKFQPGSTHIVSALNVMEQHEYREPILLRYRYHMMRMFRMWFDRPFKAFLWALFLPVVAWVWIMWISRVWNQATQMRITVKEYLALASLALAREQLKMMVENDLIEFQNEEAKFQFIGLLEGVHEELRKDFDENFILRNIEYNTQISFIQPINELIKPKKQKIFFEYATLHSYSRMIDNLHNRTRVTPDEQSLYRISNQHRARRYEIRNMQQEKHVYGPIMRGKKGHKWTRQRTQFAYNPNVHGRFETSHGPLVHSYDGLPGFFFWGTLVGLMDQLWVRDTRHPHLGPGSGDLFMIDRVYSSLDSLIPMWVKKNWQQYKLTRNSTQSNPGPRLVSTSRIRDASALYRELERYVVQGDYVRLPKERIEDPHDPFLRGIPVTVLNSSDKTISGSLFQWYARMLSFNDANSWAMYRRFLISELMICKKLHEWMRHVVYIIIGKAIPPANLQGYMKFYDETLLPYPAPENAMGDLNYKLGDEGIWDEVLQYAMSVQSDINDRAYKLWTEEFHNEPESFVANTELVDQIIGVMPTRGARALPTSDDLSEYDRHLIAKGDEWTKRWGGYQMGDPDTDHPANAIMFHREKSRKEAGYAGRRWDDWFVESIRLDEWAKRGAELNFYSEEHDKIQMPDYSVPASRVVTADKFTPYDSHLPWPKGFFIDDPDPHDPAYYTRKMGLGTRKDYDRMVRMGILPPLPDELDAEDGIAIPAVDAIPRAWDTTNPDASLIIHQRTHDRLREKARKGEINTIELLWLNVVTDKLTRHRNRSVFALFPMPYEITQYSKMHHGTVSAIDAEADNDLYSSNAFNNDWLLLSGLPSMYPIAPPLHEMNFMTTMVSRLEGVIMQLTAEIDFAALRVRELQLEARKDELQGLDLPDISTYISADDEVNMKNSASPLAVMYYDTDNLENANIRGFSSKTAVSRAGRRSNIMRLRDVYQGRDMTWLAYSPAANSFLSRRLGAEGSKYDTILPVKPTTAVEWFHNIRLDTFTDKLIRQRSQARLDMFIHENRIQTAAMKKREYFFKQYEKELYYEKLGPDQQIYKVYDDSMQITIPLDIVAPTLIKNYFEAKRRQDPLDRTKKWYHYQATDARPQRHWLDAQTGRHRTDNRTAAVLLGEQALSDMLHHRSKQDGNSNPLMKARKEYFLDAFGHFDELSLADVALADRGRFGGNFVEFQKLRADHVKQQVEQFVTLDNIDLVQRIQRIAQSANYGGAKKVDANLYSMDRYTTADSPAHSNHPRERWNTFDGKRHAWYPESPEMQFWDWQNFPT